MEFAYDHPFTFDLGTGAQIIFEQKLKEQDIPFVQRETLNHIYLPVITYYVTKQNLADSLQINQEIELDILINTEDNLLLSLDKMSDTGLEELPSKITFQIDSGIYYQKLIILVLGILSNLIWLIFKLYFGLLPNIAFAIYAFYSFLNEKDKNAHLILTTDALYIGKKKLYWKDIIYLSISKGTKGRLGIDKKIHLKTRQGDQSIYTKYYKETSLDSLKDIFLKFIRLNQISKEEA